MLLFVYGFSFSLELGSHVFRHACTRLCSLILSNGPPQKQRVCEVPSRAVATVALAARMSLSITVKQEWVWGV